MHSIHRRILLTLLLCAILLFPTLAPAQGLTLPIVFEDYPPYEYVEDGQVKGINMDLIREAFRRMGIRPFFEPRPWKRALYELEHGEILALSSGFKTPRRETFAIFPEEPLSMETNVVAALAVSGVKVESLDDLRGLRVGVVREYVYGHEFDSMHGLDKVKTNSTHQMVKMLLGQRMDVIIGNRMVIRHILKDLGKLAHVKFVYEIGSEPLYLFFSRSRGNLARDLARDFDKAIREMREDGTFSAIEAKY